MNLNSKPVLHPHGDGLQRKKEKINIKWGYSLLQRNEVFKVKKWNSATSSKGPLDVAWFIIKGIPYEKACIYSCLKNGGFTWSGSRELDKTRICQGENRLQGRDKGARVVDGILDFFFYDFFQRGIPNFILLLLLKPRETILVAKEVEEINISTIYGGTRWIN